jgi:hypothetical protein
MELVLHRRRRLHGGGENPRRRRRWNWAQLRALVCCGCKGRRRRSSACLNRAKGRKAKGAGGLRAAALAIDGRGHHGSVQGKGKRPQLIVAVKCLNWQVW